MDDRRTSERLLVAEENIERITPHPVDPPVAVNVGERLLVAPESLDRVCLDPPRRETEDRTEPLKLSFLALLADRDSVQSRLNRRITPVPPEMSEDEDRPTDPMILAAKSG